MKATHAEIGKVIDEFIVQTVEAYNSHAYAAGWLAGFTTTLNTNHWMKISFANISMTI
jgi:hypothetical protein